VCGSVAAVVCIVSYRYASVQPLNLMPCTWSVSVLMITGRSEAGGCPAGTDLQRRALGHGYVTVDSAR